MAYTSCHISSVLETDGCQNQGTYRSTDWFAIKKIISCEEDWYGTLETWEEDGMLESWYIQINRLVCNKKNYLYNLYLYKKVDVSWEEDWYGTLEIWESQIQTCL